MNGGNKVNNLYSHIPQEDLYMVHGTRTKEVTENVVSLLQNWMWKWLAWVTEEGKNITTNKKTQSAYLKPDYFLAYFPSRQTPFLAFSLPLVLVVQVETIFRALMKKDWAKFWHSYHKDYSRSCRLFCLRILQNVQARFVFYTRSERISQKTLVKRRYDPKKIWSGKDSRLM